METEAMLGIGLRQCLLNILACTLVSGTVPVPASVICATLCP